MKLKGCVLFMLAACAMAMGVGPACGQAPGVVEDVGSSRMVPMWDGNCVRVGAVRVFPETHSLVVSGWVNQVIGPIELLACGRGGKTHESVFVLNVDPVHLQTGLLLLGLKPGQPPTGLGQGQPEGPKLDLWVDWEENGETKSARAETFVYNVQDKTVLPETPWIFTGSIFLDGEFKASAEESLVVTYWDPWAIINIPLICGTNDEILVVNTNSVPPLKTPIRMRMEMAK